MVINGIDFLADLGTILTELQAQLRANNIPLLRDIKDTPNNYQVTCPYHKNGQEHRPSAGIRKSDGVFHCFQCGETHSLQEVISYCFGYDDRLGAFGWNWLLKNFLTISVEERKPIQLDYSRTFNKSNTSYISELELDKYRVYHPYMWKRKLTPEIVDIFDVGYDANTECITFPVRDITGNTLFVARRSVNTKYFNYPSGATKPIYGMFEYSVHNTPKHKPDWDANEVIICESIIDALTCWVYGKYAVALNGLGTQFQFNQLNGMPCRKFILATDNDAAGLAARKRIKANLKHKICSEYRFNVNKKDINELTKDEFDNLEEVF